MRSWKGVERAGKKSRDTREVNKEIGNDLQVVNGGGRTETLHEKEPDTVEGLNIRGHVTDKILERLRSGDRVVDLLDHLCKREKKIRRRKEGKEKNFSKNRERCGVE